MSAKFRRIADQFPVRMTKAVDEELTFLLDRVKEDTPEDTGALIASEHVIPTKVRGNNLEGGIAAGGTSRATAVYAPYVEDINQTLKHHHKKGKSLFMSSNFKIFALELNEHLAVALKDLMAK